MVKMVHGGELVNSGYDVLVDSDAFLGWLNKADVHHEKCKSLFHDLHVNDVSLVTTNFIMAEVITTASYKLGQKVAKALVEELQNWLIIDLSKDMFKEALQLFRSQKKKGTSFFDCSNVVVMKNFQIPQIFSFDRFYDRKMDLQLLS